MARTCIDVHVHARPIHVNIHMYTVHTCLMLVYMYIYVHVHACPIYMCMYTHVHVHAPPMHMYSTHTRVYIHVHAPQHVHACPIHVYMQLDYSLSVGKALPEISIACTSTTVSNSRLFDSCSAQGVASALWLEQLHAHTCTCTCTCMCTCVVSFVVSTEALFAASFVARRYLSARNDGMTFDLWSILSRGEACAHRV